MESNVPEADQNRGARRDNKRLSHACLYDLLVPSAVYTFCFFLLTYPLISKWNSHFYADDFDGLQNEWNLWWVRKAVVELHQSPWFTTWLHAPVGTTLIGHTLNPFNGLIGIPLSFCLSRVQVYNVIVTGSFVFSGVSAFWLSRYLTRLYVPALIGGFAFTFTGYHFAHARGHMQLVSMEFIPLFLLIWLRLLERPTIGLAIAAGCVLGLVELCDFYYVFYCALAGALFLLFYLPHLNRLARQHRDVPAFLPVRFGAFVATSSIFCGPLLLALYLTEARDPLGGAHDAVIYSADALCAFVPGGVDMLGRFTRDFWTKLSGFPSEQSVYVGVTVLAMAAYGVLRRHALDARLGMWVALAAISYVLSLGPTLHVNSVRETGPIMPYAWLEALLPPLKLSGCPARIVVLFALAVSMLASAGVAALWRRRSKTAFTVIGLFAIAMTVDLWPAPFIATPAIAPRWTTALRDLPLKGAVISRVSDNEGEELYCQTLYDRPMAFGYISRVPASVSESDATVLAAARAGNFKALRHDMGFVYVVLPKERRVPNLPVVYVDETVVIQPLP